MIDRAWRRREHGRGLQICNWQCLLVLKTKPSFCNPTSTAVLGRTEIVTEVLSIIITFMGGRARLHHWDVCGRAESLGRGPGGGRRGGEDGDARTCFHHSCRVHVPCGRRVDRGRRRDSWDIGGGWLERELRGAANVFLSLVNESFPCPSIFGPHTHSVTHLQIHLGSSTASRSISCTHTARFNSQVQPTVREMQLSLYPLAGHFSQAHAMYNGCTIICATRRRSWSRCSCRLRERASDSNFEAAATPN